MFFFGPGLQSGRKDKRLIKRHLDQEKKEQTGLEVVLLSAELLFTFPQVGSKCFNSSLDSPPLIYRPVLTHLTNCEENKNGAVLTY